MRLNTFLARSGVASRRKADSLIKANRVKVNGRIGQLNDEVSETDSIEVDGHKLLVQKLRYILVYKPRGIVTTLQDEENRPTIIDLINIKERIVPVGRLDVNTTGAILLTNDGPLAHRLMHPSFEIDKVYEAQVEGNITDKKLSKLSQGIQLEYGLTVPAKAKKISDNKIELVIHEGRNHQVKRMLAAVELPVKKLHRSQYGPLNLDKLKPGQWRELDNKEILLLRSTINV